MSGPTGEDRAVSLLAELSSEMGRLYTEQFGRGPVSARAAWAGPDVLTVVLEDTLTPAERNLVRMGQHERLRETRMFFQYASVPEFYEPVERLTNRTVRRSSAASTPRWMGSASRRSCCTWPPARPSRASPAPRPPATRLADVAFGCSAACSRRGA